MKSYGNTIQFLIYNVSLNKNDEEEMEMDEGLKRYRKKRRGEGRERELAGLLYEYITVTYTSNDDINRLLFVQKKYFYLTAFCNVMEFKSTKAAINRFAFFLTCYLFCRPLNGYY